MFWDSMDCECAIGIMGNVGCPLHDPRLKKPEPEPLFDTTKVKHYSTNLVYICKFCNKEILGSAQTSKEGIFHEKCFEPWKRAKAGLKFECPKCNKTGKIEDKTKPNGVIDKEIPLAPGEISDCAHNGCMGCKWCNVKFIKTIEYMIVDCNLCNGLGWLKTKPKPITAIIDWEL